MDKPAIKKFAVWARNKLIADTKYRAGLVGVTETAVVELLPQSNETVQFFDVGLPQPYRIEGDAVTQRQRFVAELNKETAKQGSYTAAYQTVVDKVAYTWFNRLIAVRYMEVNDLLPSRTRVLSSADGRAEPQIVTSPFDAVLDYTPAEQQQIVTLKNDNKLDEAFQLLFLKQCAALGDCLPRLFEQVDDYMPLLLALSFTDKDGVVCHLVNDIPESDWLEEDNKGGAVQIVGWLYQYYNTEPKEQVFANLKKNIKISAENIPAATQLFTPDWIVRYMVENSLGRLWVEGHPDAKAQLLPTPEEQAAYTVGNRDPEDTKWHYYLEEAQQEPQVQAQLAEIRKQYADLTPEQIKVIDPCCGSGHILAYLFDVLMQIYENYGYTPRDAVTSILQNNLYGLDIDDRAAQLAYFAVMMKARRYDRRFFSHTTQPHVYAIEESNRIEKPDVEYFCNGKLELKDAMHIILTQLYDAKEYGSILTIPPQDWDALYARFDEVADESSFHRESIRKKLLSLVQVAQTLAQKYDVVVTNPPYMGSSGMGAKLAEYVKKNYPDSKSDLFAVFIEVCSRMAKQNGHQAMITQHAWMFLSSFEKLREKMMLTETVNMAHLGARAFEEIGGEVVQTTSFVRVRTHIDNYKGVYCRLIEPTTQQGKEDMFLACENRYIANQDNFAKIPGSPVAYWIGQDVFRVFSEKSVRDYAEPRHGMSTGNNDVCLKLWFEINRRKICFDASSLEEFDSSNCKFAPYKKGGSFRLWYGNNDYVIAYDKKSRQIMESLPGYRSSSTGFFFKPSINWSDVSTSAFGMRVSPRGFAFDGRGASMFCNNDVMMYIAALLASKFTTYILNILNPTLTFNIENVAAIPVIIDKNKKKQIEFTAADNIRLSKTDWDSFETSWDFTRHPFIKAITKYPNMMDIGNIYLAECYDIWAGECEERFEKLKANEEELNRIFIDIYGLQDELTPEVEDKDVTVRKADLGRDVRSFISYAVGCMFGRYSPTYDGLAYAGGTWDDGKYNIYKPDADGIIPICDDEYFEDDMMGRFVEFVRVVYGDGSLEDNLRFIANALGGKGQPKEVIRNYFLNDFYADHCKIYQKRPIYWLFDSGKKNGFKCLIYLHRYQPDTIARIRTDYVHEQQARYRTAIEGLEKQVAAATSTSERVKLTKQLNKVQAQDTELHQYEEKVHALADQMIKIDLDDGVKHNYEIFKDVLAKIK